MHIKVSTDSRFFNMVAAAAGRRVGGDVEHDSKWQDALVICLV